MAANSEPFKIDPLRADPGVLNGEGDSLPFLEYLQLLWFRRWSIVALTVLSTIAGWLWVNQQTPLYRAESAVIIGPSNAGVMSPELAMLAYFNKLRIVDEIEVLKSRSLAEGLIEKLDLLSDPEFNPSLAHSDEPGLFDAVHPRNWIPQSWRDSLSSALERTPEDLPIERAIEQDRAERELVNAVNILVGGLEIENDEMSNVVTVAFRSPNPKTAALIANELPEVYILSSLQARYESTERATKWLSEQMNELREEVEEAERAVEIYRSEKGLTDVKGTGLVTEQLSVMNSQLIIAKAERAEAEARLRQVQALLQQDEAGAEAAARLSDSTLIQQLRAQEVEVQREVADLAVVYGPKHPKMIQARAEVEQVQERIRAEIEKIETTLQSDLQFALARERALEASVREAEAATGAQNREAIQLRALEREAQASRALFETFLEQFKTASTSEGLNEPVARVLSRAEVPGSPFSPNVQRSTTAFAIGGFVLAVLLVLGMEALNPGVTHPEQVEKELGRHTLGIVPLAGAGIAAHDMPLDKPKSGYVEALNTLMVSLALTSPDREPRVFQVTSSVPEEGKTTLAISLARTLAARDKSVVLVDGDLRRAAIEAKLGLERSTKGLTDLVLNPGHDVEGYLSSDPRSAVRILAPGTAEFVNATEVLSSQRMKRIVDVLSQRFDYVIVDAPPVMAVADARLIGQWVEKTVFVVRWNKTPVKVVKAALKLLTDVGAGIAGIALQSVDLKRYGRVGYGDSGYYYHYGRYGKYYSS